MEKQNTMKTMKTLLSKEQLKNLPTKRLLNVLKISRKETMKLEVLKSEDALDSYQEIRYKNIRELYENAKEILSTRKDK